MLAKLTKPARSDLLGSASMPVDVIKVSSGTHQIELLLLRQSEVELSVVVLYDRPQIRSTAIMEIRWVLPQTS
jgi:hypothetical protein